MSNSFSTLVTVRGGKLKLLDKVQFDYGITRFMDGQELVLTIEEETKKRTTRQNKFLHGPVLKAFRELGWTEEDTKTELCLLFLPVEHVRPDGAVVIVPGHTSTLTVAQFNEFLEKVIQYAAEHDVYIADADEWRAKQGVA